MKRVGELYEVVVFTASVSKVGSIFTVFEDVADLKKVRRPVTGPIGHSQCCASSTIPRELLQPPGQLRQGPLTSWPGSSRNNHHRQLAHFIHLPPPARSADQQLVLRRARQRAP